MDSKRQPGFLNKRNAFLKACRKSCSHIRSREFSKSPTTNSLNDWWWGEDSNLRRLRRQIYSLFPLAAREPHRYYQWSQRRDSNPRPTDYKSVALPAELRWHTPCFLVYSIDQRSKSQTDGETKQERRYISISLTNIKYNN